MLRIGIDIGGTTIKGGLLNSRNEIIKSASAPTNGKKGRDAILVSLFKVIDDLMVGEEIISIGISSAGDIDARTGICTYATNNLVGWGGVNLKQIIEERYDRPAHVDNDAVCHLYAEALTLANHDNVTMLTFGTGVGGASIENKKMMRGEKIKWGHKILYPNGRECNCGKAGCSESYLSANALLADAKAVIPEIKSCEELFALYEAGNSSAIIVVKMYSKYLNDLLSLINHSLKPDTIILGGGLMGAAPIIKTLLTKENRNVKFATLKNDAGIIGSSLLPVKL